VLNLTLEELGSRIYREKIELHLDVLNLNAEREKASHERQDLQRELLKAELRQEPQTTKEMEEVENRQKVLEELEWQIKNRDEALRNRGNQLENAEKALNKAKFLEAGVSIRDNAKLENEISEADIGLQIDRLRKESNDYLEVAIQQKLDYRKEIEQQREKTL
jgi:hypothetical protein